MRWSPELERRRSSEPSEPFPNHSSPPSSVAAEAQRDDLLALVPDDQSLVIARDGRVWGAVGTKAIGSNVPGMELPTFYTLVPVTSEEE